MLILFFVVYSDKILRQNVILSEYRSGFREKHSNTKAAEMVMNNITFGQEAELCSFIY